MSSNGLNSQKNLFLIERLIDGVVRVGTFFL